METAQIMMMPATTQATPVSAGTPATPSSAGADGSQDAGFGSLLGQTIDLLQQDGIVLPVSSQAAAVTTASAQAPSSQGMAAVKAGDTVEPAQGKDEGQDAAQQLAGLLQVALLMPAAVATPTATATGTADQPAAPQAAAPVAAVATTASTPSAGQDLSAARLEQLLMATQQQGPADAAAAADRSVMPATVQQTSQHAAQPISSTTLPADNGNLQPVTAQSAASAGQQSAAVPWAATPTTQTEPAKSVTPAGTAVAAEAGRTAVAEVPAAPKGTASVVAAVRFAHPADVAAATVPPAPGQQQDAQQFADGKGHAGEPATVAAATMATTDKDKAAEPAGFEKQLSMPSAMDLSGHGAVAALQHRQAMMQEIQTIAEPGKPVADQQLMRQVTDRLAAHDFKPGADQITLKLSPDHLGELQVNLRMDNQQVRVEIVAEHRSVREALLQQVDQLKESLSRQNIKMESFDVTTANNGGLMQQGGDWRQAASERRPLYAQQVAAGRSAVASLGGDTAGAAVQYFAPQYQSTLDVRF